MHNTVKLLPSSILHLHLQNYENDFTFIINNVKYKTNRFIADLISTKIAQYHLIDSTLSEFSVNTEEKGDFQIILNLVNFKNNTISISDFPFVSEIFEKLGTLTSDLEVQTPSVENFKNSRSVIELLKKHLKYPQFYYNNISDEIEFIASHFSELKEDLRKASSTLSYDIIEEIIANPSLKLENEDELIEFIDELYSKDVNHSNLYSYVCFSNVSSEMMREFTGLIDLADINRETWDSLSERLSFEIKKSNNNDQNLNNDRPFRLTKFRDRKIPPKSILFENREFDGVFNYLRKNSNLDDEVNISYSSFGGGDPKNLLIFDDQNLSFFTENKENSWICFEFRKRKFIPKNYTMRSYNWTKNVSHPKSWVIEASNDKNEWLIIDQEEDCSFLNGKCLVYTFSIDNEQDLPFRFIRIRQTGPNWANYNFLKFDSIEFYGTLT